MVFVIVNAKKIIVIIHMVLMIMFLIMICYPSGMNVNVRELTQHVEFEPQTYYAAFSAELEASASPMWALVSHLRDSDTWHYTFSVLRECLHALSSWFNAVGFSHTDLVSGE